MGYRILSQNSSPTPSAISPVTMPDPKSPDSPKGGLVWLPDLSGGGAPIGMFGGCGGGLVHPVLPDGLPWPPQGSVWATQTNGLE